MLGQRGTTWRGAIVLLLTIFLAPAAVWAGNNPPLLPPSLIGPPAGQPAPAETALEAQLLSDRPPGVTGMNQFRPEAALGDLLPGISLKEREGGAILKLPQDFEMSISFLYGGEAKGGPVMRSGQPPLLFRSSLDYSLLPNLQVGLNGFLYYSAGDNRYFQRRYGDVILGLGPGIRYDLGRWSLTLQSQYGTGGRDQKEGLQNWFRVWYAF